MSPTTTRKWIHWTRRGLLLAIAAAILAVLLLWEGFSQEWLRHELVQQIELGTGTRVEMT
jgi:hypothetical protein